MTWSYVSTGGDLEIYDHTGALVTTKLSGPHTVPSDVLDEMHAQCAARNWDMNDSYVVETLKDAAFERIEAQ